MVALEGNGDWAVENWEEFERKIRDEVRRSHPKASFSDIWILQGTSWLGHPKVEIWAVYRGKLADESDLSRTTLRTRLRGILDEMRIDAFIRLHLVTKSDVKDWRPEGI